MTSDAPTGTNPPQSTKPRPTDPSAGPAAARDFLTLSQAARLTPGKTSPNAVWRWCRRGVLARTGQRVHLQHVRLGGKLLTTRRWIDEFGERLADADKAYFDIAPPEPDATPPALKRWSAPSTSKRRRARSDADLADHHARIAAELDAEGL